MRTSSVVTCVSLCKCLRKCGSDTLEEWKPDERKKEEEKRAAGKTEGEKHI